jgi:uncharacterized protein YxeA
MDKKLIILLAVFLMGAGAYYFYTKADKEAEIVQKDTTTETNETVAEDTPILEEVAEESIQYQYKGTLKDVLASESATLRRGLTTNGNATGVAKYAYIDGEYMLYVTFENLPKPQGDDFYEGWLVRNDPFDFISTGELKKIDGEYVNEFNSDKNYSKYDFYVLTIEPNDNDPTPAGHVLEGTMDERIGN